MLMRVPENPFARAVREWHAANGEFSRYGRRSARYGLIWIALAAGLSWALCLAVVLAIASV